MKTQLATPALAASLLLAPSAAHTQEEINRKGAEVMEEYRRDRGHWVSLTDIGMVNHMVDHIGGNGMAVAGFFIHKVRSDTMAPIIALAQARGALLLGALLLRMRIRLVLL